MKVGFIGLGRMGSGMALNLRKAGYEVVVHDAREESAAPHLKAGSTWASSVSEVAEGADVVFTSLPGPKEMKEVADVLFDVMRKGSIWFDLTTNSPTLVREVFTRFAEKGIPLLDAPVSGGPSGAASGKLAIYVGGERQYFDEYRKLLDAIGDEVMYVGTIGAGNSAKLVHNSASFALRLMLAEVFTLGVKAGVEPAALWHAMRQGGQGRSRTFDRLADKYLVDNYEPASFTVRLAHKDLGLSLELARQLNVPMSFTQATFDEFDAAIQRGWGDRDSRTPMVMQNERAGVSFKLTPEEVEQTLARG
jgi:3-hydroxyisobutyrate dehydrogenase